MKETRLKAFCLVAALSAIFLCRKEAVAVPITDYYQAGTNMYVCSSTATLQVSMAAGLSQNTTGLILTNPQGSNVKLVVLDTGVEITASPAAAAGLFIAYSSSGAPTGTTDGNMTTAAVGVSTGTLTKSLASCYVVASHTSLPKIVRMLGGTTGAVAIGGVALNDKPYPPGSLVVPPGATISLQATSAVNVMAHYSWIEVPL